MSGWWANSRKATVAHHVDDVDDPRPTCGRVVFHHDARPWPEGPKCRRCITRLFPETEEGES